jgi:hypothetical protein
MRDRCSRLGIGIGLVALCSGATLTGWQPVEAQTADVLSLPGDAPGSKVAFQRYWDPSVGSGNAIAQEHFAFPGASEVRIETVTGQCRLPATQVVFLQVITKVSDDDGGAVHEIAMARAGTYGTDGGTRALYSGTHYVRLPANAPFGCPIGCEPTDPPEFVLRLQRLGGSEDGVMVCNVSVAGYATPGARRRQ